MSKRNTHKPKKDEAALIRSSAAEYLTFVAAVGGSETSVEMRYEDENIWLTQKMMSTLYDVSIPAINQHLKRIFADNELDRGATVKKYLIVQTEGGRQVRREVDHYNLQAVIAVGFKVENERAVQFRKWANRIVKEYTIQGWTMDVERLKHGGSILTNEYFERQLEKIREIRLSERKFYQKITDLYAASVDYDPTATATKRFFAAVQNKMHYAIHGNTAAEVIVDRADHEKENMGLTSWEGAPHGKIHKYDVTIAKNYLSDFELGQMQRIVAAYLDMAEVQAMRRIPMTMSDWEERLSSNSSAASGACQASELNWELRIVNVEFRRGGRKFGWGRYVRSRLEKKMLIRAILQVDIHSSLAPRHTHTATHILLTQKPFLLRVMAKLAIASTIQESSRCINEHTFCTSSNA